MDIKCRWAPSLGRLEESAEVMWGTMPYNPETDTESPCVFFGIYGLPDFYTLWRHKGKKWILWAGTDIVHFTNGYWLDDTGILRIDNQAMAQWIELNCENWCENEVERQELEDLGITAQVCPSFLGKVSDFVLSFTPASRPQVYVSVSGDNFAMYGWDIVEEIAGLCEVDFHLYGNIKPWHSKHPNVFIHGRVPKEQMNEETKRMQAGLRLCMPDGFSEILGKSVMWGQWPITWSAFGYKHIAGANGKTELIRLINALRFKTTPNTEAREYYQTLFNNYPWNRYV